MNYQNAHNGMNITLVAGKGFGLESPLKVYSELFMIDIEAEQDTELQLEGLVAGEIAFVVVNGVVELEEDTVKVGEILMAKTRNHCNIQLKAKTRLLLFGGEPLEHQPILHWNFVAYSKERLEKAKEDWRNKGFPKVPGDSTYIPLP